MLRSRFLWKLYAGYALLILSTSTLIGVLVAQRVQQETLADTDQRLLAVAALVRDIAQDHENRGDLGSLQSRLQKLDQRISTRLTVILRDGTAIADSRAEPASMENHAGRPEILQAYAEGLGTSTRFSRTTSRTMRYMALPLERDGQAVAVVRASLPLTALQERLGSVRRVVLLGAALATAVALGLGFLYARRITRPLLEMAEAAQRIADGAYEQRVVSPSRDELGRLAKAFNQMSEELRTTIAALGADRKKLTAILASLDEGLVAIDRDERILHLNQVAGRLLGVDPEAVVGRPIWEVTRLHDISEVLGEALQKGQSIERVMRLPGVRDRVLELRATPLLADGVAGAVLVVEDVTKLRHLETMRQDFVANVSHELKTPVTAIRGMIETLLDDPEIEPARHERFLHRVLSQTERMGSLVTDLLSLAHLESDSSMLEIHSLDLREPIRASVRSLQPVSETREVRIECQLPTEPLMVNGDEEALQQAISNLLDNALKFSPKNGVVNVRLLVQKGLATIEVQDHGVGIEVHHRERLFERFYRVDKARSRALGGTGLGLAIVKHISRALGGNVSVDSVPGRGSTFRIHLPYSDYLDSVGASP